MKITLRLLNLLLSVRYQVTDHALESMDEDNLALNDIVSCLATGRLRRSWRRRRKSELEGKSVSGRVMRVVASLLEPQRLRIITVYEVK